MSIVCGDVTDTLVGYADSVFDGCLCDPPYGLNFMGRNWDGVVPDVDVWAEVLRVLKPGAFLLAFGGTRTWHRLACAIEDAGFEYRDTCMWLYGAGFPKSHDISKAIDKAAGAEREVIGPDRRRLIGGNGRCSTNHGRGGVRYGPDAITAPATDAAQLWDGYGTALKPAWEPIILAQKPRDGTFANNALTWGCGGIWVDGTRIGTGESTERPSGINELCYGEDNRRGMIRGGTQGRWPANLLLQHCDGCECVGERRVKGPGWQQTGSGATALGQSSGWNSHDNRHTEYNGPADPDGKETIADWRCVPECPVRMLGEQSGERPTGDTNPIPYTNTPGKNVYGTQTGMKRAMKGDTGTAARFFYQAKASRSERNEGLDDFYWQRDKSSPIGFTRITRDEWEQLEPRQRAQGNVHPTVKPLGIIEYIAKLIMPPECRKLLVPFSGSGSEMLGAVRAGWHEVVGIDIVPEYCEMAEARLANIQPVQLQMEVPVMVEL